VFVIFLCAVATLAMGNLKVITFRKVSIIGRMPLEILFDQYNTSGGAETSSGGPDLAKQLHTL